MTNPAPERDDRDAHERVRQWGEDLKDLARRLDAKVGEMRAAGRERMTDLRARMEKMQIRLAKAREEAGREWHRFGSDLQRLRDDVMEALREVGR